MVKAQLLWAAATLAAVKAFSPNQATTAAQARREFLKITAGVATSAVIFPTMVPPAIAMPSEETPRVVTRMGGLLVCHTFTQSVGI